MNIRSILIFLFCFLSVSGFSTRPQTKNYSAAFNAEYMACDSDNLWVATWGGLVKYELSTHHMTHYDCGNSGIITNRLDCVELDSTGTVYAGRMDGGLSIFDGNHWTSIDSLSNGDRIGSVPIIYISDNGKIYVSVTASSSTQGYSKIATYQNGQLDLIPNSPIGIPAGMATDSLGNLWLGSMLGIWKYDGTSWTFFDSTNSTFPSNRVMILGKGLGGEIWLSIIGSVNGIIAKFDGTNLTYFSNGVVGNATQARKVFANPADGTVYFFGHSMLGYSKYNGSSWSLISPLPSSERIDVFTMDPYGNKYMTSVGGGYCRLHIDDGSSLSQASLSHYEMYSSYGGSVEVGRGNKKYFFVYGALYESDGLTIHDIAIPPGMGTTVDFLTTLEDDSGSVWCLDNDRDNGQVNNVGKFDGVNWTIVPHTTNSIALDQSGRLWMADSGLSVYDHGVVQYATGGVAGFPLTYINKIVIDTRDDFWIDCAGIIYKYDSLNLTTLNASNSPFSTLTAYLIGKDPFGNVWFNYNGIQIFKYDGSTWTAYDSSNSSLPGKITTYSLAVDRQGEIWFATDKGLVYFTGSNFIIYDQFNSGIGLPPVFRVTFDDYNNAWLASAYDGISVFNDVELNYNTVVSRWPAAIEGNVFLDSNQDGIKDTTDFGMFNQRVLELPDSISQFTGYDGNYRFDKKPGTYHVDYTSLANWALTTDSLSYSVALDTTDLCCYNFGMMSLSPSEQVSVDLSSSRTRCFSPTNYYIDVTNTGSTVVSANVVFHPDTRLSFPSIVPQPDFISPDSIGWNLSNLLPFTHKVFVLTATMPSFGNDTLHSDVEVRRLSDNSTLFNDTLTNIVLCSFDPNDKVAQPIGLDTAHYTSTDSPLEYTIHFENTGNDTAFYIEVRDTLDASLDLSTFELVSSSHPMQVTLSPEGAATFVFANVNLPWQSVDPIGSQGYLKYRVKVKTSTPDFTRITNTAHIYFDLNSDVTTNTTWNTVTRHFPIGVEELAKRKRFELFPNPSLQQATIKCIDKMNGAVKILLLDLAGQQIDQFRMTGDRLIVQPKQEVHGMFILKFIDHTGKEIDHMKWIIE